MKLSEKCEVTERNECTSITVTTGVTDEEAVNTVLVPSDTIAMEEVGASAICGITEINKGICANAVVMAGGTGIANTVVIM